MLDRCVHVLNDRFKMNAKEPPVDLAQPNARLPIDGFLVKGRIQALAPEQSAHDRILRVEHPRTPEPIGIPPPDVAECREVIALALADRAVIDIFKRIIADVGSLVDKSADNEIVLAAVENDAVDEVDVRATAPRRKLPEKSGGIDITDVIKLDKLLRPDSLCLNLRA